MKFLFRLQQLLIALWLGAAVFFSAAVAPSAFRVLPSGELAGAVVNQTLQIVNISGITISILLLLVSFVPRKGSARIWSWVERLLLLVVAAACGVGQMIGVFYLDRLRASAGKPIEQLSKDDPIRVGFDLWHAYSVYALLTAMGAALVVYFIFARGSKPEKQKNSYGVTGFDLPDELKS